MSDRTDRARSALKALAAGELTLMESFFSDSFIFHSQRSGKPSGRSGLHYRALLLTTTLHEATLSIEAMTEDGNIVTCRWRGRAVHRGELLGIPATGRRVDVSGITMFRFADTLIVEEWTQFDGLGLRAQLTGDRASAQA